MPDVQWNLTVGQESVSAAVQRIGQALGGLESTSSRAAGALAAALGQAQTAATATAGAVQRIGAQPLRLTDQATPALTHLVTALRELVATRVQIPVSVQDTATPALTRIRAELASLSAPGALTLTLRDDATPLLTHLRTALGALAAPAPIPLTVQDQATPVVQRLLADLQRLASTPIRIPVTTTSPPATGSPAAPQAAGAPAGAQRLAQQAAAAQGAVQSLGTRLDTLQRQLASIGQTRPSITLTSNYQTLQAEIATLQSRLTALSKQPYSVQVKTETAQVRADLAGLQRQFAGFKAELPPLAPKVDSGPVESALRRMQQGFADTGDAAQQQSGPVSSFFSNALSAATGFLAANVFSRIAGGIGGLVSGTKDAASSMESTRKGFETILQSATAADQLIKQLQTEANVSPFELENFRQGAQLLLGMGTAAQDIVPRLHEVSNVVAAVGGGTEQFNRVNLALAQIQAKGKVQAQEINQLAENGVAGWDILAKAMNKTQAQVIDLAGQGKISAQEFFQTFAQFANSDQISKAAEAQSHTFQGLLSTISDIGQALETAFGTPVIAAVEPVLERIVSSLQDPAVLTTLGQWGAAAGQFVVGLINAGQTAFTVAQQIIQALQPVTDFLGQLFGLSGQAAPAIKPPDLTGPALSAAQYSSNVAAAGPAAKSAGDQIKALEAQTRDLSRATAEANVGYDHRKQSLQDQLTLLDRQYQAENKAADVQSLQEKIAKDRALAVDQYSSQGQAAASRLVDEEARLKALQREQGHDAAKAAIDDRIKSIDREKQATDEASAARTRALQEQMDALRAAAAVPPPPAFQPPKPGAGPDKSKNRNVDDAFGGPDAAAKGTTILGLLDQLATALKGLSQGPKAAIDSLMDSWNLLLGGFGQVPAKLTDMGHGFDDLIDTLGGKGGLQGVAISVRYEFERLFESLAAAAPTVIGAVGRTFTNLGDSINVATTSASELIALFKLQTGAGTQAQFDQAHNAAAAAQETYRKDQIKAMVDSALQGGTYSDRIKAINADLNARETRDLTAAAARTQASRDARLGGTTQASAEYASTYGPQVTTTTARTPTVAPVQHNIRMEFDANGFKRFIDANTGQVLAEALR